MNCAHEDFSALVTVVRIENGKKFQAEVIVNCAECGIPFLFLGLPIGLDLDGATISVDGLEARLAISPQK